MCPLYTPLDGRMCPLYTPWVGEMCLLYTPVGREMCLLYTRGGLGHPVIHSWWARCTSWYTPLGYWEPYYPGVYSPVYTPGYTQHAHGVHAVHATLPAHADVPADDSLGSEKEKPMGGASSLP